MSGDVILFSDGVVASELERTEELAAAGIRIRTERLERLEGSDGRLERVMLEGRVSEPRDALFVVPELRQPSALVNEFGLDLTDAGLIACDADGRTTVPGVYAAAAASLRSVAIAIGTGARTAKAIVIDLASRLDVGPGLR